MQYTFDIKIPNFLIVEESKKHNEIDFDLLYNKVVIGLCGYARSGKDSITSKLVKDYGFERVAFADILKDEMNSHMKTLVYEDLQARKDIDFSFLKVENIDFKTDDSELKPILRPYIIWYGELLRELNGPYYWINRAFEVSAKNKDKIVISDVRRPKELEVFEDSNSFYNRTQKSLALGNYFPSEAKPNLKPHNSLLFYVNQYGLTDEDSLTKETILKAQENWLFDDTFYIDSRIPKEGIFRKKALEHQIKDITQKFNINKTDRTISKRQLKMF